MTLTRQTQASSPSGLLLTGQQLVLPFAEGKMLAEKAGRLSVLLKKGCWRQMTDSSLKLMREVGKKIEGALCKSLPGKVPLYLGVRREGSSKI